MTGHRFVNRKVIDRQKVVLAQERVDLRRRPVDRQRRHRVEGFLTLVEGARRITVGQRHTAAKLRHDDDLQRIVRHPYEVLLTHEGGGPGQRIAGGCDELIRLGQLLISDSQHGTDHELLVMLVWLLGEPGIGVASQVDSFRDFIHLVANPLVFGFGAVPDLGSIQWGVECKSQFLVIKRLPDTEVALRVWQQRVFQPCLVLRNRGAGQDDRIVQRLLLVMRQNVGRRYHQVVDGGQDTTILSHSRFSVDNWYPCGLQCIAHIGEELRQLLQTGHHVHEPDIGGRKFPGHEAVDRQPG